METLLFYYTQFMEISKANPIVASVLGVGLGGTVVMWLRGAPTKLWTFFQNWFSYSIVLDSSNGSSNARLMGDISTWVSENAIRALIRKYMLRQWWSEHGYGNQLMYERVLGMGTHYAWYKGRLVVVEASRRESQGSEYEKYSYSLRFYTTNQRIIDEFVAEIQPVRDEDCIELFRGRGGSWGNGKKIRKRPLDTLALCEETKEEIVDILEDFVNSRDWYIKHSISYKLCMVLEGPSGTGKTSLAKAIASWLGRNIYSLSLSGVSDDSLLRAFSEVPKGSLILLEDFDTNNAVQQRMSSEFITPEDIIRRCANLNFELNHIGMDGDTPTYVQGSLGGGQVRFKPNPDSEYDILMESLCDGKATVPNDELWALMTEYLTKVPSNSSAKDARPQTGGLTLSGILNALDGVDGLEDIIVVPSTNHIGNIDEALLRKGRVDHIFHIGLLTDREIRTYLRGMYENILLDANVEYVPMKGCDLEAAVLAHKNDPQGCLSKLKTIKEKEVNVA